MQDKNEQGFTLIELSMVLIVIGLILGMIFKGKSLLEQAKNRSVQSQLHKIQLSVELFRQQYGHWPGDGCIDAEALQCTSDKNGSLDKKVEQEAFWRVLIRHQLLSEQDRQHAFGRRWEISTDNALLGHQLTTVLPVAQACLLDRQIDDGMANTGTLQVSNQTYRPTIDCQTLHGESETVFRF